MYTRLQFIIQLVVPHPPTPTFYFYFHGLLYIIKAFDTFSKKYVWVIDQVLGQDGWILAKFFFACLGTETESRSIKSQKKNEANIQPSSLNKFGQ